MPLIRELLFIGISLCSCFFTFIYYNLLNLFCENSKLEKETGICTEPKGSFWIHQNGDNEDDGGKTIHGTAYTSERKSEK